MPLSQYCFGYLAQSDPLHFGAVRTIDDWEALHYDDPFRDFEARQLFRATFPQGQLV